MSANHLGHSTWPYKVAERAQSKLKSKQGGPTNPGIHTGVVQLPHTSLYGGSVESILLTATISCLTPRVKASRACSRVWPFFEMPASNSPVPAATTSTAQSACTTATQTSSDHDAKPFTRRHHYQSSINAPYACNIIRQLFRHLILSLQSYFTHVLRTLLLKIRQIAPVTSTAWILSISDLLQFLDNAQRYTESAIRFLSMQ